MKTKRRCVIAALLLFFSLLSGFCEAEQLDDKLLRLHVRAADDSPDAQARKLAVRDAVLAVIDGLDAPNKEEAARRLSTQLDAIRQAAEAALAATGEGERVRVSLERRYFPRKAYGDFVLPAGYYDALCVDIGAAAGQNWWCLAYPPLCLPAAQRPADRQRLRALLTDAEYDLITQPTRYRAKFALLELLRRVLDRK